MEKKLTTGSIPITLFKLALPIMGTGFIQMAYNLTDIFWISKLGAGAVAAVGLAGMYGWLGMGVALFSKVGTEILVAQKTGAGDEAAAQLTARTGMIFTIIISAIYSILVILFRQPLVQLFNTGDSIVESNAMLFLSIIASGFVFSFLNMVFTGIFNARGNSKIPFRANATGLVINIVLDPLMIYGYFGFPALGITGAAIATVLAQLVVSLVFFINITHSKKLFKDFHLLGKIDFSIIKNIFSLSILPAVQSMMFTLIAIAIGRIIAHFGSMPIAVQRVGAQIESISWMSANGIGSALVALIGQNKGANEYKRVFRGYEVGILIAVFIGIFNTILLTTFSKFLFSLFMIEPEAILLGSDYLIILGYSQLFMCIEIILTGVLYGISKTKFPAIISVGFNLLRIPLAYYLSHYTDLGINGIWWAISISSVLKGLMIFIYTFIQLKPYRLQQERL